MMSANSVEWIVEAHGCSADRLRDMHVLQRMFSQLISDLNLHTIGEIMWHQFPDTGGVTGLALLSESHLACHTFPEHQSVCLNLFTCRPRARWNFEARLKELLDAQEVNVRTLTREYICAGVNR